ncbi:MAG: hypothetical protein IPL03_06760 [Sterolibacteriaceae bacterium]|nr:hypothetical protein [Candidatus Methylophosphatis haderslevensis]
MTMAIAAIIGLAAAVLLLSAGYLFGVKRGAQAREQLRQQDLEQTQELARLREQLSQRGIEQHENLKATIAQLLSPLIQRDRLSFEPLTSDAQSGRHGDLNRLLDQIAEKGNFATVLLSDNEGWPLAASSNAQDQDRLGATASMLLLIADRMGDTGAAAPLSLMVHDAANTVTLCRIFSVGDHRLALTAVSPGTLLLSTALDPALVKVDAALLQRERDDG